VRDRGNLPDRLTVVALEAMGGAVPVVRDVHDLQSLCRTPYEDGFAEPADPCCWRSRRSPAAPRS
jgi:hypothetical protein